MASQSQPVNLAQSTPAVTITPASPTATSATSPTSPAARSSSEVPGEMKEKMPTDSETALVGKGPVGSTEKAETSTAPTTSTTGRTSPLETLTRRLSGKAAPTHAATTDHAVDGTSPKQQEKTVPTSPVTPAAAASTSRSLPSSAPASKPAQRSTAAPTQKKKKKRKGLAGLFVALGCLSAEEIDDDSKAQPPRRDMSQKPGGAGVTKPATAPTAPVQAEPTQSTATTSTPAATPAAVETVPVETASTVTTPPETTSQPRADLAPPIPAISAIPAAVVVAPIEPVHVPEDETAGVTSGAVQPPGSGSELLSTPSRPTATRRESDTASQSAAAPSSSADLAKTETSGGYTDISESDIQAADDEDHAEEHEYQEEYEDEEDRLIAQGGMGIPLDENGQPAPLLPPMDKAPHGRKCLVLDLDETLLHSSFKMLPTADYIVPVEIESQVHNVYVIKRPGVDHFLTEMGKIYEVVIFTASLSKYADPVLDMLDPNRVVRHRLFRESCYNHKGNYVKDLSQLGRDMEGCIIIDNSPASYIFHPNNAVPVSTWFNDPHDTELTDLCPFLTDLATVDDIRGVLDGTV